MLLTEMACKAEELAAVLRRAAALQAELGGVAGSDTPGDLDRDEDAPPAQEEDRDAKPAKPARPSRPRRSRKRTGAKKAATREPDPEACELVEVLVSLAGSQREAAAAAGMRQQDLSAIVCGRRRPSPPTLARLREAVTKQRELQAWTGETSESGRAQGLASDEDLAAEVAAPARAAS